MPSPLRYDMTLPNGEPLRWDMGPEFTWDGDVPSHLQPNTPMQQNDASIVISAEAEADILATAELLRTKIAAFAKTLTEDERESYFKLGDKRTAFDQKCDNYMHQHPNTVPPTVNVAEYDKDGAARASFLRIRAKISEVNTPVDDTLIVIGADRMDANLAYYHYLPLAADAGISPAEGLHADLKETYPGGHRSRKSSPTPPAA